ncbi:tannase and feruloyl esterase-domain-containing protein [Xylogone sp. PMI_703]|nr:tannase and feruloyl esterase-domain-containing protein [Xylogone sp. PMI_703]
MSYSLAYRLGVPIFLLLLSRPLQAHSELKRQGIIPCVTISPPKIDNAQVLHISAAEVLNFSGPVLVPGNNNFEIVSSLNVCDINVTYTHPGVNDTIITRVWLPLQGWNGRFQGTGGGGYVAGAGSFSLGGAVAAGFSAASTDGGNLSSNPSALGPQVFSSPGHINFGLFTDFSSRTLHEMAVIGKQLSTSYYGRAPHHSYWTGCSTGGRQGYIMAQKYPTDYDGILANAPAVFWTPLMMTLQWPQIVMETEGYNPTQCEYDTFINASISLCDPLDGVTDGIIGDPNNCPFDPYSLVGQTISCGAKDIVITNRTARIVSQIHTGPTAPSGLNLWNGYNWGTSLSNTANITARADGTAIGNPYPVSNEWIATFVEENPNFNTSVSLERFLEIWIQSSIRYEGVIGTESPDLSEFRSNGGKLMTWQGLADVLIPPNNTLYYRHQLEGAMGGYDQVNQFHRLFYTPGVAHCTGGYGPIPNNPIEQLVSWVENGVAPESIPASYVTLNVLFKLKSDVSASDIENLEQTAKNMVGKVPGLIKLDIGPPHPSTAHRAQGFNIGLVAVLDAPETIKVYAEHPEHLKVVALRESLCTDALAYDLEYPL